MDEPYRSPAPEPGPNDQAYPAGRTEAFETHSFDAPSAETRQFPPAQGSSPAPRPAQLPEQFTDPHHHAPAPQYPAPQPYAPGPPNPAQQFQAQQFHAPRQPMGYEPLAHEGGLPYGNPPAPAYPQQQQFIPQHLAVPPQYATGPYPPQQYPPPYMYPPQHIQQTVVMNNGRRVNHLLHFILTLLTGFLWLPVWIILSIANS